eukprot:13011-Pelagomonas_calceolata.AAC.2
MGEGGCTNTRHKEAGKGMSVFVQQGLLGTSNLEVSASVPLFMPPGSDIYIGSWQTPLVFQTYDLGIMCSEA